VIKKGDIHKLDGHTRDFEHWSDEVLRPEEVYCLTYIADSYEEYIALYKSHDNKRASENTKQEQSGVLRELGIRDHFQSKYVINGFGSVKTLQWASKHIPKTDFHRLILDNYYGMSLFDSLGENINTGKGENINTHILAAFLMVAKIHGPKKHLQLLNLINGLYTGTYSKKKNCPIKWILNARINNLYSTGQTDESDSMYANVGAYIEAMEKYIANQSFAGKGWSKGLQDWAQMVKAKNRFDNYSDLIKERYEAGTLHVYDLDKKKIVK
jgi:hypothetical protein